jgi:ketosteroid isomerase-like protein
MSDNTSTVAEIYEAFGRGDVPAILDRLTEDVGWDEGGPATTVPWLIPGSGKAHVGAFFQAIADDLDIEVFEPCGEFLSGEHSVAVPIHFEATIRKNGAPVRYDLLMHLWWFDEAGKVTGFRHVMDMAPSEAAWAA